jgi:hypothetical protein
LNEVATDWLSAVGTPKTTGSAFAMVAAKLLTTTAAAKTNETILRAFIVLTLKMNKMGLLGQILITSYL